MRSFITRKQVKSAIPAQSGVFDSIFKPSELPPFAGGLAQIMSEISAIPIGDRPKNPGAVLTFLEHDFGDAREVFAKLQFIFRDWRAELVKPGLLIKIDIRFGLFALMRVASVKNPRGILSPRCAPAAGRILDARDSVLQFFASIHPEEMQRALFTAAFGKRQSNHPAVGRGA